MSYLLRYILKSGTSSKTYMYFMDKIVCCIVTIEAGLFGKNGAVKLTSSSFATTVLTVINKTINKILNHYCISIKAPRLHLHTMIHYQLLPLAEFASKTVSNGEVGWTSNEGRDKSPWKPNDISVSPSQLWSASTLVKDCDVSMLVVMPELSRAGVVSLVREPLLNGTRSSDHSGLPLESTSSKPSVFSTRGIHAPFLTIATRLLLSVCDPSRERFWMTSRAGHSFCSRRIS